jgi:hypothetical protein
MEGLGMEKVGIFYVHLKYILAIWYLLLAFCNLMAIWYIFPILVYYVKKNLATLFCCPASPHNYFHKYVERRNNTGASRLILESMYSSLKIEKFGNIIAKITKI